MTEEPAPYHVSQEQAQVLAYEHLYRVVFGNKIAIRCASSARFASLNHSTDYGNAC